MQYFRTYVNVINIWISNWLVVSKQSLGPPWSASYYIDRYLSKLENMKKNEYRSIKGPLWGLKPNIAHMAFESEFWRRLGPSWHNNEP